MPDDVADRARVLVTGGTRGIGAAVAERLARSGHDLVLAYRSDVRAAHDLAARLRAYDVEVHTVVCDVTDAGAVHDLVTGAAADGRLCGVVHAAGATLALAPLARTPVEVVRAGIDLNLTAAVLVAREAVRHLGPGGVLVLVSSAAATLGSPGEYVWYAAAKAGVDALVRGLAVEVAPVGVRVVGVAPGIVDTRIHADAGDPDRVARVGSAVPLGRAGTPDEAAGAVVWALGPDAAYVTGTTLRVAGGR